ncbi:hypothetical protein ATCVNEJV3_026L [Acanthocystis turfacea Chlorella virus NE-JV-3]|nr:hypothetical protein ATCVNEJV3_026L [Acanthocystis turfacea Chlorella virus NE-JV-3]
MTTLQYYWADGSHTAFDDYVIDKNGVVTNINTDHVMSQYKNRSGYNNVGLCYKGKRRPIRVARALASTFIGPPPTLQHTVDHEDGDSLNDTLKNVRWLCRPGQRKNQKRPTEYATAFIIVKDGVEHTAKEWLDVFKKPNGQKYHENTIREFAKRHKYEFRYKTFQNIRREVWKAVPGSKNSHGEWFVSNMSRMKYKTKYMENVLSAYQLAKDNGYPKVNINGNKLSCHELSMMTFRPREYAAKLPGDQLLHKHDDRNDFNPFRLRWGTPPENSKDAHKNGKFIGKKTAQKPVVSYINNVFEIEHDSLGDAVRYLQGNGYPGAYRKAVSRAIENNVTRYGRTWKLL